MYQNSLTVRFYEMKKSPVFLFFFKDKSLFRVGLHKYVDILFVKIDIKMNRPQKNRLERYDMLGYV